MVRPRAPGSCLTPAVLLVPLQPLGSTSVSLPLLPLCLAVIKTRIPVEAATSVGAHVQALTWARTCPFFPRKQGLVAAVGVPATALYPKPGVPVLSSQR